MSLMCDVKQESCLNIFEFSWTLYRVNWDSLPFGSVLSQSCSSEVYSALFKFGYGGEFIDMIQVVYTNIPSKTKINGLLSDPFTLISGVCQRCPLSYCYGWGTCHFTDADARIKGVQIGDHEIKQSILPMTSFFLRDITCLTRIEMIVKL